MLANQELITQIGITADQLDLQEFVIEKDFYLTAVIGILSTIEDENFSLVFQGGTCLAKAHNIIERMSEDCDFRIAYKFNMLKMSKEKQRKHLRAFRKNIVTVLKTHQFTIDEQQIRIRNEGQFMAIPIKYPSLFPGDNTLKPYLALEFFLNNVKLPSVEKSVTSLIQQTLGDKVNHPRFTVTAMSVVETAAEKWVALTRRIATSTHRSHYLNANLVRHLYDLHKINENGLFTDEFANLVPIIVDEDKQQYKNHSIDYYCDPVSEIQRAINELNIQPQWRDHWQRFVDTMVFSHIKPSYDEVLQNFLDKSTIALAAINA